MSSDPLLVVDSSVLVKWFVPEGELHVAEAWALLEGHLNDVAVLAAPEIARLEVNSALKRRGFAHDQLLDACDRLDMVRLCWRGLDAALARDAADLSARFALTPYDAAFAALALDLGVELVTEDLRLAESGACPMRLLGP
jgi:predicted nucleic acid-binding protein